jgi:hypothetical protein
MAPKGSVSPRRGLALGACGQQRRVRHRGMTPITRVTHIVWHLQVECDDGFEFQILAGVDNAAGLRMKVRVNKFSHNDYRRVYANIQDKGSKVEHVEAWPSV